MRLGQALLRVGVLQLDRADAAQVVEVPALLLVAPARGQLRLAPQLLRLVVHVVVQVVAHQEVQDRLLADLVEPKRGDAMQREQRRANLRELPEPLVREGVVKHDPRLQRVQGAAVELREAVQRRDGCRLALRVVRVQEEEQHEEVGVSLRLGEGHLRRSRRSRRGGDGRIRRGILVVLVLRRVGILHLDVRVRVRLLLAAGAAPFGGGGLLGWG